MLPPLEYGRAWHVASALDFKVLKAAANQFVGMHDFAAFAANRGQPEKNTVRKINSVQVRRRGPCLTIEFEGEGFLYKMARLMVGSIVQCGLGKLALEEIGRGLTSRQAGAARVAAPAEGLFLVRVRY